MIKELRGPSGIFSDQRPVTAIAMFRASQKGDSTTIFDATETGMIAPSARMARVAAKSGFVDTNVR